MRSDDVQTETPATFADLMHARRDIELAELRHRVERLIALIEKQNGAAMKIAQAALLAEARVGDLERRLHVLELAEAGRAGKQ